MPSEWPLVPLSACAKFQEGYVNPSQHNPEYFGHGYKWLRATDLNNGFVEDTSRTLTEAGFQSAGKSALLFKPGTLAISKSGTIGRLGILKDYMCGNRAVINIAVNETCDTRFIFYSLLTRRKEIETLAEGSVQKNLYISVLGKLELLLPSLDDQKAVAETLGSLDDKIALLRDTNVTLEAIAQALFKSWFVDFDPVRAKAEGRDPIGMPPEVADLFPSEFEDSELGEIPRGWRRSSVGKSFILTMGQSPPGETYNTNGEGLPFYQGRTDFGFRFPEKRVYCTAPTRLAEVGDTLVSVRAPVGDVNMALEPCCLGRGVAGVRHPMGYRSFTFYALRGLRSRFDLHDKEGTVFGSINKKDFQLLPVIEPTSEILEVFNNLVSPLDTKIIENEGQVRTLTELRDTLLPRLMSGKLRIPEIQETIEEATA